MRFRRTNRLGRRRFGKRGGLRLGFRLECRRFGGLGFTLECLGLSRLRHGGLRLRPGNLCGLGLGRFRRGKHSGLRLGLGLGLGRRRFGGLGLRGGRKDLAQQRGQSGDFPLHRRQNSGVLRGCGIVLRRLRRDGGLRFLRRGFGSLLPGRLRGHSRGLLALACGGLGVRPGLRVGGCLLRMPISAAEEAAQPAVPLLREP